MEWQEIEPKTAKNIAEKLVPFGFYTQSVVNGARELNDMGFGYWEYMTQYASGATLWHSPSTGNTAMFESNGYRKDSLGNSGFIRGEERVITCE